MRNMCLSKLQPGDWPVTATIEAVQHSLEEQPQEVASFYGCHSCWFPENSLVPMAPDDHTSPEGAEARGG